MLQVSISHWVQLIELGFPEMAVGDEEKPMLSRCAQCPVPGACAGQECQIPGAWCLVPGAWCLVFGAWCLVLGAWCLVPGTWCLVFGAWCLVPGACAEQECLTPSAWCLLQQLRIKTGLELIYDTGLR